MSEVEELRKALMWALVEGAKGFYTTEAGMQTFYHCKFCHAVAISTKLLSHEDDCKLYHAKKLVKPPPPDRATSAQTRTAGEGGK